MLIRNEDQTVIAWIPRGASVELRIPDGIRRIGAHAFANRSEIVSVMLLDSVVEIGRGAFRGCASLREINFGNGLARIDDEAFRNCSSLTRLSLPDSVVEIGQGGFQGCASLCEIDFGNGLARIDAEAFMDCAMLTRLWLPDSMREVGETAFGSCRGLMTVSVSQRIDGIRRSALDGCKLSDFVIRGCEPPRAPSIRALVDGFQRCEAEVFATVNDIPYRFAREDEMK